jgi:hypothetical protein
MSFIFKQFNFTKLFSQQILIIFFFVLNKRLQLVPYNKNIRTKHAITHFGIFILCIIFNIKIHNLLRIIANY